MLTSRVMALSLALAAGGAHLAAAGGSRPDVLVVTFDTLRRDHVSAYGHERLTTPTVDALARRGVLFTDCQSAIPVTGPSHATMFTGLYPQSHGAFRNGVPIASEVTTLAELLSAAGYRTHAAVAGWTLRKNLCGLDRGFQSYDQNMQDRYHVTNVMRTAPDVTDAVLRWIDGDLLAGEGQRDPYFLFVHYFDPHEPYEAPGGEPLAPNPAADGGPELTRFSDRLEAYDREIAFADAELGRLLEGMEERGLLEDAVVVFTADHGQSFGEHGYGGRAGAHGRRVYQSTLAVPLVVSSPGRIPEGRTSDLPVAHVDLLPTIAGLVGLPERALPGALQGYSLEGMLRRPDAPAPWGAARRLRHGVAFGGATGNPWNPFRFFQNKKVDGAAPRFYTVLDEGVKVIVNPRRPHRYEVYDLTTDPGELSPLREDRKRYQGQIRRLEEWFARTGRELRATQLSDEDREKLEGLGYVGN